MVAKEDADKDIEKPMQMSWVGGLNLSLWRLEFRVLQCLLAVLPAQSKMFYPFHTKL